jgi:hypothetical protein
MPPNFPAGSHSSPRIIYSVSEIFLHGHTNIVPSEGLSYTTTSLMQMSKILSSVIVPFFRGLKIPVKRFLGISPDAVSSAEADAGGELETPLCAALS